MGLFVDTTAVGFLQAVSHCHGQSLFGLGFHSPIGRIPNSDNQIIAFFVKFLLKISPRICAIRLPLYSYKLPWDQNQITKKTIFDNSYV